MTTDRDSSPKNRDADLEAIPTMNIIDWKVVVALRDINDTLSSLRDTLVDIRDGERGPPSRKIPITCVVCGGPCKPHNAGLCPKCEPKR